MIVSYSHKFIFLHMYRVAGQSVSAALKPYAYDPDRFAVRVPVFRRLFKRRILTHRNLTEHNHGHPTARELQAALPPKVFNNFFKFTFARNPWDWQVSVYHFVLQYASHPDNELFKSFGRFENYLDWRINRGVDLQKDFVVSDSGALLVDFIGHYETLAEDFQTVCNRVAVTCSLPHKNSSKHKNFREYYNPQTKALVAEAFKDDIDFFGYDFDETKYLPPILGPAMTSTGNPPKTTGNVLQPSASTE